MRNIQETSDLILAEIEKIIKGKRQEIKLLILSIFSGGHTLIDDVPGTGKTTMAKAVAKALGCESKRVQFVSDSLPGDILGVNIYNQKERDFELRRGPVFTNLLFADEINRAMPRTQSALLEAMEEKQVTIDGAKHLLPEPFIVIATENPVEYESTFPLPISQLDRFFIKLTLGYPGRAEEKQMLMSSGPGADLSVVREVIHAEELLELQARIVDIHVSEKVLDYIIDIVSRTRNHEEIAIGASPRAAKHLLQAAKSWAAMHGRDFAAPDDVQAVAPPVLGHRLVMHAMADVSDVQRADLIGELLQEIKIKKD